MIIHKFEQHSEDWYNIRKGKFTCSTLADLFMGEKTKGYNDAINKIVFERLTGEIPDVYVNNDMKRGTELEPYAREKYQMETFNDVEQVGFIEYNEWFGYSPDGLVGDAGLIEIKCPRFTTLIDFALSRKIPKEYLYQMQGGLLASQRQWCDFVMFHPKMQLIIEPHFSNSAIQEQILEVLDKAIKDVQQRLERLQ